MTITWKRCFVGEWRKTVYSVTSANKNLHTMSQDKQEIFHFFDAYCEKGLVCLSNLASRPMISLYAIFLKSRLHKGVDIYWGDHSTHKDSRRQIGARSSSSYDEYRNAPEDQTSNRLRRNGSRLDITKGWLSCAYKSDGRKLRWAKDCDGRRLRREKMAMSSMTSICPQRTGRNSPRRSAGQTGLRAVITFVKTEKMDTESGWTIVRRRWMR